MLKGHFIFKENNLETLKISKSLQSVIFLEFFHYSYPFLIIEHSFS